MGEAAEEKKKEKPSIADDPEFNFRILSVFSYFVVLVVIGIPVWYYTTRVYRASFPIEKIDSYNLSNTNEKEFGLPLAPAYDILITIVNPDPRSLDIDLKGEHIEIGIQPLIEDLKYAAQLDVKSQWLYLVDLGVNLRKIIDHYALDEEQLPHVITPLEVKLWSNLSPRPCFNLVLYISPCDVPLYIYDKGGKKVVKNAFYSPRWGGIFIMNPDKESCVNKTFKPDINKIAAPFQQFILKLFDLESTEVSEMQRMVKTRTFAMINSARRTVKSLTELLSEIKSIVISDEVAAKIDDALVDTDRAEQLLEKGQINEAVLSARKALTNAENAFYDPSLLALLYFPDDQKYAVYIPLFLPVMIPVFMSLLTVVKWYFKRKQSKVKLE